MNTKNYIARINFKDIYFHTYEGARAAAGPDGKVFKNLGGGIASIIRG